jgi:acyl dehydratase
MTMAFRTIFKTPHELKDAVGQHLGTSEWVKIDQERINGFAEATDDHQWIHVDADKAKDGPFGGTIAHGYLTLALVNRFLPEIIDVQGTSMGVNYGCDKVRFPSPVKVNSRVRGVGELIAVEEIKGAIQSTVRVTVEIENSDRPACVVETISRYFSE